MYEKRKHTITPINNPFKRKYINYMYYVYRIVGIREKV